jgi:hypothetical protein
MHGLTSFCYKLETADTMESIVLNMRAPFLYPTSTSFDRINRFISFSTSICAFWFHNALYNLQLSYGGGRLKFSRATRLINVIISSGVI